MKLIKLNKLYFKTKFQITFTIFVKEVFWKNHSLHYADFALKLFLMKFRWLIKHQKQIKLARGRRCRGRQAGCWRNNERWREAGSRRCSSAAFWTVSFSCDPLRIKYINRQWASFKKIYSRNCNSPFRLLYRISQNFLLQNSVKNITFKYNSNSSSIS